MIRVALPYHLRVLAKAEGEVELLLEEHATVGALLEALETKHPVLRGTIRDQLTLKRRPFVRFFACKQDLSHEPPDSLLPPEVMAGREPFVIVGAMAGG